MKNGLACFAAGALFAALLIVQTRSASGQFASHETSLPSSGSAATEHVPRDTSAAEEPSAEELEGPPTKKQDDPSSEELEAPIADVLKPFTMRIGARLQIRSTHLILPDVDSESSIQIRRGRLSASGAAYDLFDYAIQLELAGSSVRLIDANVRATLSPHATLWFGQGKAYFGRQQLNSSGTLHFVDRNIVDGRFAAGRQQGLGLTGRFVGDLLEYNVGAYNGNGINQSRNPNNRFMTVGRLVATPFGSYSPAESAHDYPETARLALGISAMHNTVGDGTDEVSLTRWNTEGAFKLRGLNMTAELYRELADPQGGDGITTYGWYYQAGILFPGRTHELAGRYAGISSGSGAGDLIETGVAYSYYFQAHSAKVQADIRNVRDQATGDDHREIRVQFQLTL